MDLDKSFPVSEGIVEIETGSQSSTGSDRKCLNCETLLVDTYCAHCGQKDIPRRQTIGDLFINFIASFWSFESKFLKTGRLILFKPGFLPTEYNKGKRESYFHPARMYVFASFVYFLLLAILPDPENTDGDNYNFNVKEPERTSITTSDSSKAAKDWNFDDSELNEYKDFAQYDSAQQKLPEGQRDGFIKRLVKKRGYEIREKYKGENGGFASAFGTAFTENSSKIFFLLLPLFALILKLLHVRRDFYYSEHLVFSVYYYNFFFVAGSLYMLLEFVPIVNHITWLLVIWIVIYLLFALKRMYRQSWGKTILKFCLFSFLFSCCILVGLAVNAIAIFLMI